MDNSSKTARICAICRSTAVLAEAYTRWNIDTQAWEISTITSDTYCETCDISNTDVEAVPVAEALTTLQQQLAEPGHIANVLNADLSDDDERHYLLERLNGEIAELETFT